MTSYTEDNIHDAVHAADKKCTDLQNNGVKLLRAYTALDIALGQTNDDARAKKMAADLRELEDARRINAARLKAASDELDKLKIEQNRIGYAGTIRTTRRNVKGMTDNIIEMVRHLEAATKCYIRHYDELGPKIKTSIPVTVNDAMLLDGSQLAQRLALELWRLVPCHPAGAPTTYPPFPGSKFPAGQADPAKMETLVDAVKEAAAYIVRCVEEGGQTYTSVPLPIAPVQEPVATAEVPSVRQRLTV